MPRAEMSANPLNLRPGSNLYLEGVSTYTIGEVADRSGFSASALRYYEGIGLVEPTNRTGAGYRIYDDHTLARLAFIARAKQLGCSLEEITDLVTIWDGDRCGPVQRHFHELITDKIHSAQRQLAELTEFSAQLHAAADHLSGEPVDGPCGDDCACVTADLGRTVEVSPVMLVAKPADVPIACTLEAGAMPDRLADWNTVLDRATARIAIPDGGLRIEFDHDLDLGQMASLVAAEQRCCAFFSFSLMVDNRGIALEVRAPEGADGIIAELFGQPA
jgi:DNA-binding transcriptional MerR regulator